MTRKTWTPEDMLILRRAYADTPSKQLADILGCSVGSVYRKAYQLGLHKSSEYLNGPSACRLNGSKGEACRFSKGNEPHNKGKKGWKAGGRSEVTQFKPGCRRGKAAEIYQPVGTERVTKDGYLQRKVNDDPPFHRRWRLVHQLVWEERYGSIPNGYIVTFKNGNRRDLRPENLQLTSRIEQMRRNTIHRYPPTLKQAIRLAGKLRRVINEK